MVQFDQGLWLIRPQGGGNDVFVHISAVERAGLRSLNEGQAIEFELVSNRGGTAAENLRVRYHALSASASGMRLDGRLSAALSFQNIRGLAC